jgi:uncharacterized protein YkwD
VRAALARAHSSCSGVALTPAGGDTAVIERATLCLINQVRSRYGLAPLRLNRVLARVASNQARGMVRGNYFGDQSVGGRSSRSRILAALAPARAAASLSTAQNVGWGTGHNATAAGMVRAWLRSPPHRRIILTARLREAGVGIAASLPRSLHQGSRGAVYAMEFTSRAR